MVEERASSGCMCSSSPAHLRRPRALLQRAAHRCGPTALPPLRRQRAAALAAAAAAPHAPARRCQRPPAEERGVRARLRRDAVAALALWLGGAAQRFSVSRCYLKEHAQRSQPLPLAAKSHLPSPAEEPLQEVHIACQTMCRLPGSLQDCAWRARGPHPANSAMPALLRVLRLQPCSSANKLSSRMLRCSDHFLEHTCHLHGSAARCSTQ